MRIFMMFLRRSTLLFFTLCVLPPLPVRAEAPSQNPFVGDAQATAEGKKTFEGVCAGYCHVTENSSRPGQCPNLFDCEWKNGSSDADIFHIMSDGVPKTQMIGFKGRLPDEMLWKIITYLRSASKCQEDGKPAAAAH
jgi:mono/diheme cytochrome c family protein